MLPSGNTYRYCAKCNDSLNNTAHAIYKCLVGHYIFIEASWSCYKDNIKGKAKKNYHKLAMKTSQK